MGRGSGHALPVSSQQTPTGCPAINFTLTTSVGVLHVSGETGGGGGYQDLLPDSRRVTVFGVECRFLGLDGLIQVKRAAGRPKDLEAIAELEALREERQNQEAP
jgi:hypothetical protein